MTTTAAVQDDPRLPVELLLRDLRAAPDGLSSWEAARRLAAYGPNELQRRQRRNWFGELVGLRRPHRPGLAVVDRPDEQPDAAVGRGVRDRLRRRPRRPAAAARRLRDRRTGTAQLALLIPFPIVVWGTDELWRARRRRVADRRTSDPAPGPADAVGWT